MTTRPHTSPNHTTGFRKSETLFVRITLNQHTRPHLTSTLGTSPGPALGTLPELALDTLGGLALGSLGELALGTQGGLPQESRYPDEDRDGSGAGEGVSVCPDASGYAEDDADCDDTRADVMPGAEDTE